MLGVRSSDLEEADSATPWRLTPSRGTKPQTLRLEAPLPKPLTATLAQGLFVNKAGLPSPVLAALKRIAAFQNPEFHKKQNMRLSTAGASTTRLHCFNLWVQHLRSTTSDNWAGQSSIDSKEP